MAVSFIGGGNWRKTLICHPIKFLLARDNRTSANVADCYNFFDF
jgi:hypothetical protein